jgi:hypothetical protein
MRRDCVQIPRMSIRQDIIRQAGESTEGKDQRPVTWEILELNAKTKLDKDDLEGSRATVVAAAKKLIKESHQDDGMIPFMARPVKNVQIDGTTYRMPMDNLVFGVYHDEENDEYYFDFIIQNPKYIVKF